MDFNKQIGFRPSPEMVLILEELFGKHSLTLGSNPTMKEFFEVILSSINENNNSETINILRNLNKGLENKISELENTVLEIEKDKNKNGELATALQLQLENNKSPLFSENVNFKLWCILQVFKKTNNDFTFENMIEYIINSFQNNGYLKFDNNDLKYIETIKSNYDGTLK